MRHFTAITVRWILLPLVALSLAGGACRSVGETPVGADLPQSSTAQTEESGPQATQLDAGMDNAQSPPPPTASESPGAQTTASAAAATATVELPPLTPTMPSPTMTALPALDGMALPAETDPIGAENVGDLSELALWGQARIRQTAWSADGALLAVATAPGIHLHDAQTLDEMISIETGAPPVSLAFSPDDELLASGHETGLVQVWRVSDGELLHTLEAHTREVSAVAFSPITSSTTNGAGETPGTPTADATGETPPTLSADTTAYTLASASLDGRLALWVLPAGDLVWKLSVQVPETEILAPIQGVAFSPDGALLAGISFHPAKSQVSIWQALEGVAVTSLPLTAFEGNCVAFSPDGVYLAASDGEVGEEVSLWTVADWKPVATLAWHSDPVAGIAFTPDGAELFTAPTTGEVTRWRVGDGKRLPSLRGLSAGVTGLHVTPDGDWVTAVLEDGVTQRWRVSEDKLPDERSLDGRASPEHIPGATRFTLSAHGDYLAAESWSDDLSLWRMADGAFDRALMHGASQPVFAADGALVAGATPKGRIHLWQVEDGELAKTLHGPPEKVLGLTLSPDSSVLAALFDNDDYKLWGLVGGMEITSVTLEPDSVSKAFFSPDSETFATTYYSSSADNQVRLWITWNGAPIKTLDGHTDFIYSLAFPNHGFLMASASRDRTARLWDTRGGETLHILEGHTGAVKDVAFSPDGRILASASNDRTVRLWRAEDGVELVVLDACKSKVARVRFTPDGRFLFIGCADGLIPVWGVE